MPGIGFALLSLLMSARYLIGGVGYVLDDWFALGNARFEGNWAAAGVEQWHARPGAGVLYALVFGILGGKPLVAFLLLSVISAASAVLFWQLVRRFLPTTMAVAAVVAWIILPNHTSLEVWLSAVNIAFAVVLTLAGLLVMLEPERGRRVVACLLFALAALSYEAVMPVIAGLTILLPWIERRRADVRLVASVGLTQAAVAAWILVNWNPAKEVGGVVDLSQVPAAHFGWGVVPAGPVGKVVLLVALVVLVVPVARLIVRRDECGHVEWATVVGLAVIGLGVVPFVRFFYAPLGAGDRFNVVSAFGGALLWAVIFETIGRIRRTVAVSGAVVVLALALVAREDRARLWSEAARDAVAIQHEVVRQIPEPGAQTIVIGPKPTQVDNIVAFIDRSNLEPAMRLAYDDSAVSARLSTSADDFADIPASDRVDVRPVTVLGSSCSTVLQWLRGCEGRLSP